MPKVKFTALVSDMKGKANGSVFASNSGGTYFRTNKWGGGRKSIDWNKNKNAFADLSSSWKSLTEAQKEAWKDARTLYPTTNAFGEPRIPTSFELYMRLNGTLQAAGLDTITVPATPRSMPQVANIELIIPDKFCFTPSKVARTISQRGIKHYALMNNLASGTDFDVTNTVSMRFITPTTNDFWVIGRLYQLASLQTPAEGGMLIFMEVLNANYAKFYCSMGYEDTTIGASTYIKTFIIPRTEIAQQIHIIATANNLDPASNMYYINGTSYAPAEQGFHVGQSEVLSDIVFYSNSLDTNATTGQSLGPLTYTVYLGSRKTTNFTSFGLSDFRFYGNAELVEACSQNDPCEEGYQCYFGVCSVPGTFSTEFVPVYVQEIYRGYILGKEIVAVGFENFEDFKFKNAGTSQPNSNFELCRVAAPAEPDCCQSTSVCGENYECFEDLHETCSCILKSGDGNQTLPNSLTYGPLVALQDIAIDGVGFYMQLYYSKLISNGRSIEQVPYVLAKTYGVNEFSQNISDTLLALTGNFSDESTFAFKALILDGTTGQVYDTEAPIAKPVNKKVRFKAGADLSGKVN